MSWGGAVIGQFGQGVSSGLAFEQAKQQGRYYQYLADKDIREAQAAEKTAEFKSNIAQDEAAAQAGELKGEVAKLKGAQIAAMAAMGISGVTADDILKDSANKAKLDEINLRYNADIESWSAMKEGREESWSLRNDAEMQLQARRNLLKAAKMNMMATTFLGASSSLNASSFNVPVRQPTQSTTITGGRGGTNTGRQTQTVMGRQQSFPTWSPYKLN
jgi:hypothetical protein